MKKVFYIFILMCLFITPVSVYAYKLSLTGSDNIDKTEEYTLSLDDLEESKGFYGFTASLNYDKTKLELLDIVGLNDLNLSYSAKTNKILLYTATGVKNKTDLIKLKFKNIGLTSAEEATFTFDNINATDSLKDIKVDSVSKKIKATSAGVKSDTNLEQIKINGQNLDLENGQLNYEIVVSHDTKKIDIKALAENSEATVSGDGTYELNEGSNEIKIEVTDKAGETKTYTVNVNRENANAKINEDDLFIKSKKFNYLYLIPIGILVICGLIVLVIKRKGKR